MLLPTNPPNIDFTPDIKGGTLTARMIDQDGSPNNVIDLTKHCKIDVHWSLEGKDIWMLHGFWRLQAYIESIGPGPEKIMTHAPDLTIPNPPFPLPNPPILSFHHELHLTPGTVTEPGPYKIVVILQHLVHDANNVDRRTRLCGFAEIQMVTFEEPEYN